MKSFTRIIIYYFTGTGNAKNVAFWIQNIALQNNIPCEIINLAEIGESTNNPPSKDALIFIISPVHGFNYPPVTLNFISHFPKGNNDIILMNTRAGMLISRFITPGLSGITFYLASLLLIIKGYSIKGMYPVDMPSNWLSFHPCLNDRTILFIHQKMKIRVEKYALKFINGKSGFPALREIVQDIAISPVSLGYYMCGRFVLAKTFYASAKCNNCGLCIKKCPVKAIITVNNRPFWKLTCESCMRCMSYCPHKAIETAHGFIFAISVVFNIFILSLIEHLFPNTIQSINPYVYNWVIQFALFLVFLVASYRVMHYMLKFKRFEKVITYTSLTFFKFWGKRYRALRKFNG